MMSSLRGYTMQHNTEVGFTIHSRRYFLGELEDKDLLKDADLPFRGGLWPSVQSGFPKPWLRASGP